MNGDYNFKKPICYYYDLYNALKKILIIFILIGLSFSLFSSSFLLSVYAAEKVELFGTFSPGETLSAPFECLNPMSGTAKIWLEFSGTAGSWFSPNPMQCGILDSLESVYLPLTMRIPYDVSTLYTFTITPKCEDVRDSNIPCKVPTSFSKTFAINVESKDITEQQTTPEIVCGPDGVPVYDKQTNEFIRCTSLIEILEEEECEPGFIPEYDANGNFLFCLSEELVEQSNNDNGGCLIATATFGSELAPQVQQLRELRDNTILNTVSGASFMTGFNTVYYSFAPIVSDWERENPVFKEAIKLTITPLLSSLSLLSYADIDSEAEMLGYGISVILLNIGMYFVVPVIIILKIKRSYNL